MNMKKTIAAMSAAAVAVSAMATTVSALESKSYTYSLTSQWKAIDDTVTFTATINNIIREREDEKAVPASANVDLDTMFGAAAAKAAKGVQYTAPGEKAVATATATAITGTGTKNTPTTEIAQSVTASSGSFTAAFATGAIVPDGIAEGTYTYSAPIAEAWGTPSFVIDDGGTATPDATLLTAVKAAVGTWGNAETGDIIIVNEDSGNAGRGSWTVERDGVTIKTANVTSAGDNTTIYKMVYTKEAAADWKDSDGVSKSTLIGPAGVGIKVEIVGAPANGDTVTVTAPVAAGSKTEDVTLADEIDIEDVKIKAADVKNVVEDSTLTLVYDSGNWVLNDFDNVTVKGLGDVTPDDGAKITFDYTVATDGSEGVVLTATKDQMAKVGVKAADIKDEAWLKGLKPGETKKGTLVYTNVGDKNAWVLAGTADTVTVTGLPGEAVLDSEIPIIYTAPTKSAYDFIDHIDFTIPQAFGIDAYILQDITLQVKATIEGKESTAMYHYTTDKDAADYVSPDKWDGFKFVFNAGGEGKTELTADMTKANVVVTIKAKNRSYGSQKDVNDHKIGMAGFVNVHGTLPVDPIGDVTAVTAAGGATKTIYVPFKTKPSGRSMTSGGVMTEGLVNDDIITYLQGGYNYTNDIYYNGSKRALNYLGFHKTVDGGCYQNVQAVINDAIENYENVTFTFHTATAPIVWLAGTEVKTGVYNWAPDYQVNTGKVFKLDSNTICIDTIYAKGTPTNYWNMATNSAEKDGYSGALLAANGNADNVIGIYITNTGLDDWRGDSSYMAFGSHAYDVYYGNEGTGNAGYDWVGTNLFAGALVINENITMSLSDTDVFDWTATTLSFDWDAIQEGRKTDNAFANYVHTMKLATSQIWYWDSMELVLTAGEAEDVETEAEVEGGDETLDEEEPEIEEEEEPEVEAEPEPEEEPAPVVENPKTGNASVALAVIPVALAAAAIVAKKRS